MHHPQREDFSGIVRQFKVLHHLQSGFLGERLQGLGFRNLVQLCQQVQPALPGCCLEVAQLVGIKRTQKCFFGGCLLGAHGINCLLAVR